MPSKLDYVIRLGRDASLIERFSIINRFSNEFNWNPTDSLKQENLDPWGKTHLLVEHGLEQSAILTFVPEEVDFAALTPREQINSLSISYNNLVDWQLYINQWVVYSVFNRTDPPKIIRAEVSEENTTALRSEAFQILTRERQSPTQHALDDALIQTIRFWRIHLAARLGEAIDVTSIASLFNSIIFARALEDNRRYMRPTSWREGASLMDLCRENQQPFRLLLRSFLERELGSAPPPYVLDDDRLSVFDSLDRGYILDIVGNFYKNRFAPYDYNFSLISKHALSKIYEKYVVLLKQEESAQTTFLEPLPRESKSKVPGAVYTPQYIARFFARYLENVTPPSLFRQLKVIDPACGSGIFLRNVLELQSDPLKHQYDPDELLRCFQSVYGYDIDENAVKATELSIALLFLTLTDNIPETLNVFARNSIAANWIKEGMISAFDAVVANPPYIATGQQSQEMRVKIAELLGSGKSQSDLYVAFVKLSIELIKPGGFGMLVLPHSFLISESAADVRNLLLEKCWINLLADLSEVEVFEGVGVYVLLIIFQKKQLFDSPAPQPTILKCRNDVGRALESVLKGKLGSDSAFSLYEVSQSTFQKDTEWFVLPPTQSSLDFRLRSMSKLEDFMEIRIGFSTGNDDVFVVQEKQIPKGEEDIWIPYLPDRQIFAYSFDSKNIKFVFYPFDADGELLTLKDFKKNYPNTYSYLLSKKADLSKRAIVSENPEKWWVPNRSRNPERMLRPKIITPHLSITPRFALDQTGKFAVSRSPLLYPKSEDSDLLKFFLAILNSTVGYWHINTHSHKYRSGYNMIEPKTLKKTPVPDPTKIDRVAFNNILKLVDRRLGLKRESDVFECERKIDIAVSDIYGLTSDEQLSLGMVQ